MARRNDHTREELMEMAISAGQKIISEDGFDQFSARKVAKEIGYTVGTIYNIFDSHNDLILHINSATLDDMYAFITHKMNKKHSGNNAIKNLFSYYIMFAQENYNRWSALFEFNIPQGDSLPDWQTNKILALFALVETLLLPIVNNDKEKAERYSRALWAGAHGICQLGITGKLGQVSTDSIHVLANSLIDNFINGIKI